jgi:hypothetical protein
MEAGGGAVMGAGSFVVEPQPTQAVPSFQRTSMESRLRQAHRWVAIVFTLTVAANFAAMISGPPPAWITYSPLAPLLILLVTGLYMLGRHYLRAFRTPPPVQAKG